MTSKELVDDLKMKIKFANFTDSSVLYITVEEANEIINTILNYDNIEEGE